MAAAGFLNSWEPFFWPEQLQLWPQSTSFSHYVAYLFVTISFIVFLTTNSTVGGKQFLSSYLFQYDRWIKEWGGVGGKNRKETARFCLHSLMLLFQSTLLPCFFLWYNGTTELPHDLQCIGKNKIIYTFEKSQYRYAKCNISNYFVHRFRLSI